MKPDRWQQGEKIYHGALERDESQREAFLEEACGGDDKLKREVESLLEQESQAEAFLQAPALEVAAQELARDQAKMIGQTISHYRISERSARAAWGRSTGLRTLSSTEMWP